MNVSKSQYYEFRHNIMNLGNQNCKYSWRIRNLENPQTGTQFANSVLMYKISFYLIGHSFIGLIGGLLTFIEVLIIIKYRHSVLSVYKCSIKYIHYILYIQPLNLGLDWPLKSKDRMQYVLWVIFVDTVLLQGTVWEINPKERRCIVKSSDELPYTWKFVDRCIQGKR